MNTMKLVIAVSIVLVGRSITKLVPFHGIPIKKQQQKEIIKYN